MSEKRETVGVDMRSAILHLVSDITTDERKNLASVAPKVRTLCKRSGFFRPAGG